MIGYKKGTKEWSWWMKILWWYSIFVVAFLVVVTFTIDGTHSGTSVNPSDVKVTMLTLFIPVFAFLAIVGYQQFRK